MREEMTLLAKGGSRAGGTQVRDAPATEIPLVSIVTVVRNAENCCFVLQSILNPVPVERKFTLNGTEFDPEGLRRSDH